VPARRRAQHRTRRTGKRGNAAVAVVGDYEIGSTDASLTGMTVAGVAIAIPVISTV
jgi:hypothetical protein